MTPHGYPFIHPLLGTDDSWAAYRLEFAAPSPTDWNPDALCGSEHFTGFDQRHPWFIPAHQAGEHTPERVVFFFPGSSREGNTPTPLEAALRQAKRKLASESIQGSKLPGSGTWDYLFIPISQARSLPPFTLQGMATRTVVIATDVHSPSDRAWALANACALSTGEYLLARATSGKKADTTRQKMLTLLALIAEDADTGKLDEIFRQEAKLSYSLLRLVNSAAIAPRTPITSFIQAINLLGRRQLERWLQLLVYADPNNGQSPNPLLYKAATRGRLMELLALQLPDPPELPSLSDSAFMIGAFSLLDILLNMSTPEILQQLPLCPAVQQALARHEGVLGKLLSAIAAADARDLNTADRLFGELEIPTDTLLDAQLQALAWANRIRPSN